MVVLKVGDWVLVKDIGGVFQIEDIYNGHAFLIKNGSKAGFRYSYELTKLDEGLYPILSDSITTGETND